VPTPIVQASTATERPLKVQKPHWGIVALGLAVLLLFAGAVIFDRAVGSKTVEDKTMTNKTTTVTKGSLSDTELTGLLGVGAVLVLVGFLYQRITVIKLLGQEIDLNEDEQKEALTKIQAHVQEHDVDPATAALITANAYRGLLSEKRQMLASKPIPNIDAKLDADAIDSAVNHAIASIN
jgi:hypothetical protein